MHRVRNVVRAVIEEAKARTWEGDGVYGGKESDNNDITNDDDDDDDDDDEDDDHV